MKILRVAATLVLLMIAALTVLPLFCSNTKIKSEYSFDTTAITDVTDASNNVVSRDTQVSCNFVASRETTEEPQNLETKINEAPNTTKNIGEESDIITAHTDTNFNSGFNENTIEKEEFFYSSSIKVMVTSSQKEKIDNLLSQYKDEIIMLAKLIYTEAGGVYSDSHKAAVAWCVLNRVDNIKYGDSIKVVITAPHQFAYKKTTKVYPELLELATDVVVRWLLEKEGFENVGRVLPKTYLFFDATGYKGLDNRFRENFYDKVYWDWGLESPYLHE